MGDAVPPGKAGWFLIISQMTEDKFLAAVEGTGATLIRSNLTEEQEEQLKHAFGAKKHKEGPRPPERQAIAVGVAMAGGRPEGPPARRQLNRESAPAPRGAGRRGSGERDG